MWVLEWYICMMFSAKRCYGPHMLRLTTLECFPSSILAYVRVLEQYKDYMNMIANSNKDMSIELIIFGLKFLKVLLVSHNQIF